MRMISHRTHTFVPSFLLVFTYGNQGGCFAFDCDKVGKVDETKLSPCALKNYTACMSGHVVASPRRQQRTFVRDGETMYEDAPGCDQEITYTVDSDVRDYGKYQHNPGVGECDRCKRHVTLHGFTNTCECGADYNMSGQLLASRSQWGEETGESLSDILSVDADMSDNWDSYEPNTYAGT